MAKSTDKVIVTCAITGAIHTPSMSPGLPWQPQDIAKQAIDAARAGAAILHLHARNPEDGRPSGDPAVFRQFLSVIKESCDAVINITTGGGVGMPVEQRVAAAAEFKPEMCSLNMGSMNFGIFPLARRERNWRFDWEKPYLDNSEDAIFPNTFRDIRRIVEIMGAHGTRFEFECYDVGHLYNLAHMLDRKVVKPPLFVQTIFGILGGIGVEQDNLVFMRRTADRLFGGDYVWSVLGAGRHQFPLTTLAATMGGNVRVGLEDNLFIGKGQLAKDNAELVTKMVRLLDEMSLVPASPDEARQILQLKGRQAVGF
ncbi:MAG: 3-keto-5-aminohexanoate cleavage protein [Zoogloeaceae bacterium]|nr:3-keto-5-aminohexanoate cleavage protein [Zoogloeaceae bacterium]